MKRQRLFVTGLKSIGLVASGDNPDAEVRLFKSRDPEGITFAEAVEGIKKARAVRARSQRNPPP